jgi:CMP-N,N'-diacetyllegionaminic acid synthase
MAKAEVVGLITARGGSKGIPGKNIKAMAGKPMIAWTIEAARGSGRLSRVIVSTDDEEIARVARNWGAEVPFLRPMELAEDTSPHLAVIDHALEWFNCHGMDPEFLCLLQPTSPLRTAADISSAIDLAISKEVNSVIGVTSPRHHPLLTMRLLKDGTLVNFIPTQAEYRRRQDFPPAYVINGAIYVNRCDSIRAQRTMFPPGSLAYVMPPERSIDVDTPFEFFLAEQILARRHEPD